jgi:alpha-D-xyloside xylohydrolase
VPKLPNRLVRAACALILCAPLTLCAQQPDADVTPGAAPNQRPPEPPVPGLTRRDADTLSVAIPDKRPSSVDPGPDLLLHDFDFDGTPVPTTKLHLRQLSPGVLEIRSVASVVGYWRFHIRDAANYYGLGEHFDTLNHAHTIVRNASEDNGGAKGTSSYKPMPFFMSTSGYGIWVDTTSDATFDMNASDLHDIIVDLAATHLRIVIFQGPKFPTILDHFTALAGRAILPPYWAFAPWKGRDYHQNDAQVREDIDRTRSLSLPASVILIDSPWATAYNTYVFNPRQFEDAPAMVKHLHEQGYKLILWHTSWINSKSDPPHEAGFEGKIPALSPNYAEAAGKGFFIKTEDGKPYVGHWWKGEGSLIDFTNPAARHWWQDQLRLAINAGADGFKDDDAEGSFLDNPNIKLADGSDPRLLRNRYDVLYNNAVEELVQKDLKGNGVLFARSVSVGANGIGMLWGGDNEASFSPENGLPTVVTAGLGAGLSGLPLWASDLGGYEKTATTPDATLLMRWTEYSAFSPVMEVMSEANISPWDFDAKDGGTKALDNFRRYSILHMSLFPYRYAAAQEAAHTGMPLMRALVLDNQDDAEARIRKDEYLFGPDLLVAPLIDENLSRTVYFPKNSSAPVATWLDYWTGLSFPSGSTLVAKAPLDLIPVYVRAGAVLPKIPEDVMTLVPAAESGNATIKTLDERRIYEIVGSSPEPITTKDFEDREIVHSGTSLKISGSAKAHIIVRWKFVPVQSATIDGTTLQVQSTNGVSSAEFDYTGSPVTVDWK